MPSVFFGFCCFLSVGLLQVEDGQLIVFHVLGRAAQSTLGGTFVDAFHNTGQELFPILFDSICMEEMAFLIC